MKITKKTWRIEEHGITIEVTLHAEGEIYTPQGRGIYCYYIYIQEAKCNKEKFKSLWLEDKLVKYFKTSPERVTHDYYRLPILEFVELHGGITFYQKHGHSVGHRAIQIGCDYNHSCDQNGVCLEQVISDARASARQVAAWLSPADAPPHQ